MSTPAFCTYAEEHPDWVCYIDEHPDAAQDSKLQGEHRYDGVIARATLPQVLLPRCSQDFATPYPPEHRTTTDLKLSHEEWYNILGVGQ